MNEKIYVIDGSSHLREMEARDYDDEDLLQSMLAEHPDLLAGHQINEDDPRRWMLVAREIGVPDTEGGANRWSLDHLFLDQDGMPTLVEVKRASDTRIRREVVGQMFDYAANALLHWPLEKIRHSFEATCASKGQDPQIMVAELLGVPVESEGEVEEFWQKVEANLQLGHLRLMFLADRIPVELRRIIEFLNEHMSDVEVLGVELRQFVDGEMRALVPRVIGVTLAAEKAKSRRSAGRQWDEGTFFSDLSERAVAEDLQVARAIVAWAREQGFRDWWGNGKRNGSYVPVYDDPAGVSASLFALWSGGSVEMYFQHHQRIAPFDDAAKRAELMARLNAIPTINLPPGHINRRPSFPLSALRARADRAKFFDAMNWLVAEVHAEAMNHE